jgi:hypothetical protein
MSDPVRGIAEMARVTRPGGVVAASVWDMSRAPLTPFWRATRELGQPAAGESGLPGTRAGHLVEILEAAGLGDVEQHELTARVEHPTFDDWWEPYTYGIGNVGNHMRTLDDEQREALREQARKQLGDGPFVLEVVAWAARGRVA